MNYVLIIDYPYITNKIFFKELDEAMDYEIQNNPHSSYYRLCNARVYQLEKYSERQVKEKKIIDYSVIRETVIYR